LEVCLAANAGLLARCFVWIDLLHRVLLAIETAAFLGAITFAAIWYYDPSGNCEPVREDFMTSIPLLSSCR
jgi:hypothetical protein